MHKSQFLAAQDIYLREVNLEDVNQDYYNWLNDPEINYQLETRFVPQSIETIRQFVSSRLGSVDEQLMAICLKDNDKHIGNIKIGPIDWLNRRGVLSLFIGDKTQWGKGYASQAISSITKHAFETLNLNKVQAGAFTDNHGSIKAFMKSKYVKEGVIEEFGLSGIKPRDLQWLGMTSQQYFEHKS